MFLSAERGSEQGRALWVGCVPTLWSLRRWVGASEMPTAGKSVRLWSAPPPPSPAVSAQSSSLSTALCEHTTCFQSLHPDSLTPRLRQGRSLVTGRWRPPVRAKITRSPCPRLPSLPMASPPDRPAFRSHQRLVMALLAQEAPGSPVEGTAHTLKTFAKSPAKKSCPRPASLPAHPPVKLQS